MDIVWYSLKVAFVGMLVVFVGLVILIGCIKALKAVGREKEAPQTPDRPQVAPPVTAPVTPAAPPPQPAPQAPRTYVPGPHLTRKDDALYAVITAAIAKVLEAEGINPEGGFAIRSVKPLNEAKPGPELTPKDDAFYAVLTAAIARVLEAEGINPEGGFAIRSVKPL